MMPNWEIEKKVAATLVLALIGISYLTGVVKVRVSVGSTMAQVEKRYGPETKEEEDLESFLEKPPEALSHQKLIHIAHAHLLPYTLLFALLSFFVIALRWSPKFKMVFLLLFAAAIVGEFGFMFLTRFLHPSFKFGLVASGALFGLCVSAVILASLYEIWMVKKNSS